MKRLNIFIALLSVIALSETINCALNLTGDPRWMVKAAQKPETSCTVPEIERTELYKEVTGKKAVSSQQKKDSRILLYNLCGETLSNSIKPEDAQLYQKLFSELKITDKITPVQSAILSAIYDPATGCPIAGFFGSSLANLNQNNKNLLCYACHHSPPHAGVSDLGAKFGNLFTRIGLQEPQWLQSRFLMQGDWKALEATCSGGAAQTAVRGFCSALHNLPDKTDVDVQKMYMKCVSEGHIKLPTRQICTELNKIPLDKRTAPVQKMITKCISEKYINTDDDKAGADQSPEVQDLYGGAAALRERKKKEAEKSIWSF